MVLSILLITLLAGLWYVDSTFQKGRIKKLDQQIQRLEKMNLVYREKIKSLKNQNPKSCSTSQQEIISTG